MRIVVLDSSPYGNAADGRSDALLAEAARKLGHETAVLGADGATWEGGSVALCGEPLRAERVLGRADIRSRDDLAAFAALLRAVEASGTVCLPSASALLAAEDKLRTHEALLAARIPVLPTAAFRASHDAAAALRAVGRLPVVVKSPVGWGGVGVTVCRSVEDVAATVAAHHARSPRQVLLLQRCIDEARVETVQVVGLRIVGAFRHRSRGGYEDVVAEPAFAEIAIRAVAACGLRFGSVDLIAGNGGGPAVLEVNSMPGLDPDDAGDRGFADAIVAEAARTG